ADLDVPPAASRILGCVPNPFTRTTALVFELAAIRDAELVVFDALGRRVRTLLDGSSAPGRHVIRWDGRDDAGREAASGVYFVRLRTPGNRSSDRLVLLR
ncbi:MAG: T9SS type A sorting domain-containing protein, partial [Candidatus Eisenbacteria bacterium]|nr:T9SS type A sorting domain-containing protein [Candidatus Latescibacterota bacterium]MBD3302002.1 T9SS type A sorting domain-containing protein [Candidatus Eisenbacteria bacterium]